MAEDRPAEDRVLLTADELNARYREAVDGKASVGPEDFRCRRCGVCCTGYFKKLSLHLDDLFNAAAARGMEPIAFYRAYGRREEIDGKYTIVMDLGGGCPFHEEGRGCTIHGRKPTACRSYPFLKTEIMYVGDQPYYQKIPGCAFGEMNRDALIRHDVEAAVTAHMWDRVTDCYLRNFEVTGDGLRQFYENAKGYVGDPVARAMIRDETVVTTMKLNAIYREQRKSLPADDARSRRDEIVFYAYMQDGIEDLPPRVEPDP